MKLKENGGFNIVVYNYAKGSSSKLLLDTVSLLAAPSLSGAGVRRNARKTTERPGCVTAVSKL